MAFGSVVALDDVDLHVDIGEVLGVIGPNGAGKTTLVNVLTGYQAVNAGRVLLDDRDVTGRPPHVLARAGIVRSFQSMRLFSRLTVAENVESAALGGGLRPREARRLRDRVLDQFALNGSRHVEARRLPHGDERRVALARAVATRPRFLILDEPAAGLDGRETVDFVDRLQSLREWLDLGLLIIEHDVPVIMRLCTRIQVLDYGRTIAEGSPEEVRAHRDVVRAYLGSAHGVTG